MKLVYSLSIPFAVGLVAAVFMLGGFPTWYPALQKPTFLVPTWLLGPVWSLIYLLMGTGLYLVREQPPTAPFRKFALVLFGIQLTLNGLWPFLFFVCHSAGAAFADVLALWAFLVFMTVIFIQVREAAGLLQVPYIVWTSYATVLNYTIWQLNR